MTKTWPIRDAKNQLSQIIDEAEHGSLQFISKRGELTAVLMSIDEFHKLQGKRKPLVRFFVESPLKGIKLDLERQKDLPRDVDL